MFKAKELIYILIVVVIAGFVISLPVITINSILMGLLYALIIIFVFVLGQKIFALLLNCKTEIDLWELKRYGFKKKQKLKTGFPLWLVVPILFGLITNGFLKWTALLNYEVTPIIPRKAKKRYSELTEKEVALIGSGGPIFSIALAFIMFLVWVCTNSVGFKDLSMLSLWLSFFSLIPLGKTTGTKIFFGEKLLWVLLIIFSLIMIIFLHFITTIGGAIITIIFGAILAVLGAATAFYFLTK